MSQPTKTIKQLVYSSIASRDFSNQELKDLLVSARTKNTSLDITGMLLFRQACFIQVLEGPPNHVEQIYREIIADQRHSNVTTLYESLVTHRSFADWAMAFNADENDRVEGLSDFLHPYRSNDEQQIPEGAVKKLLRRFREINKR